MPGESREVRKNRRIRWLRHLLLVASLLAVAALVAIFLAVRHERGGAGEAETGPPAVEPTGNMVTVGKGFERTFTEGNRPIFSIRGDSFAVDRKGIVYLTGVGVTVFQEDGSHYQVEGKKARVEMRKKEARLVGAVKLSAPDGLVLTTSELLVTHHGHRVKGPREVHLALGDAYRGRADKLAGFLTSRRFVLSGLVDVHSLPGAETPFRLQTRELTVDRTRKLLRTDGWAVLHHGADRVSARQMVLFFADDEHTMRFLRAHRRVRGVLRQEPATAGTPGGAAGAPGPAGALVSFQTANLGLLFGEDGRKPRQIDLDRGPGGRALMHSLEGPDKPRYRLSAPTITGYFEGGAPVRAEAGKGVVFASEPPSAGAQEAELAAVEEEPPASDETPAAPEAGDQSDPEAESAEGASAELAAPDEDDTEEPAVEESGVPGERRATGEQATASFAAHGGLSKVEVTGDVVLTDVDFMGRGARAVFTADRDRGELFGQPAVIESDRGRMEAPHILYTRADGLLHGTGGVRARLAEADDTALGGTPLTRGEGPVWVEAEEGYLRDRPRTFLFHGRVRAWRGENLLVADELRGDDAENRLVATGEVRTLFTPEDHGAGAPNKVPGKPAAGASGAPGPAGQDGQSPIEATSDELTYRRDERLLIYTGSATAKQEDRTLTGKVMEIHLAEQGGMDRLTCTGDVHVDDPAQGRSLTGERAVYDPAARTVEVEAAQGGKVTMHDKDGNVIEGPRMIYEIDQNRVHVLGRTPEEGAAPAEPVPPAATTPPAPAPPTPQEPPPR